MDSDLVFDVRFLPNPFYIQELKELTGNDAPVSNYVMNFEESNVFLDKLTDMLEFLIPQYIAHPDNLQSHLFAWHLLSELQCSNYPHHL